MNPIIRQSQINSNLSEEKNLDIALCIRYLKEQKIEQLFNEVPDKRQQSKGAYSLPSLLKWALSVSLFRQNSKHAFQTTMDSIANEEAEGILNFLGSSGKNIPHSSTVDHALSMLDYESVNEVLIKLMDKLIKKKVLYNHQELQINHSLLIGADGYWIHKYDRPHSVDENGNNCCPYCLPRTQHKGTLKEKTHFVHVFVTFTLITNAFTIPICIYPLKAKQVNHDQNDDKLKQ